ncbi:MAG: hypothetical protein ACRD5D_02640, partial [Candidatus Polarisedimenticolia bacterium]
IGPRAATAPGRAALDLAFRFASAIVSDDKDRARAQEAVTREYAARGEFDEAVRAAGRIEGWRQGAALAEIAAALAEAGRDDEARRLIARAEAVGAATSGWQGERIRSHVAAALAALGDAARAESIAIGLASQDRQYAGRPAVLAATALARRGDARGALERLAVLDGDPDLEVSWWRTAGYLEAARHAGGDAVLRKRALEAARRSAEGIAGWKRAEALTRVADEQVRSGRAADARGTLRRAAEIVRAQPDSMPVKARLLAGVARGWHRAGRSGPARDLLESAEAAVAAAPIVDRPGLYAAVAAAAGALGDPEAAARLYGRGIESAESLRNARPRALSAVDICVLLGGEAALNTGALRTRLERLLAGLGDPW